MRGKLLKLLDSLYNTRGANVSKVAKNKRETRWVCPTKVLGETNLRCFALFTHDAMANCTNASLKIYDILFAARQHERLRNK